MYADDFCGEVIISSENELILFLRSRPAFDSNNFVLTFNENGFPQLNFFVKNSIAVLYFLEGESGGSFVTDGGDDGLNSTEVFYENIQGETATLSKSNVVSVSLMLEAALQFYKTKARPACCDWIKL